MVDDHVAVSSELNVQLDTIRTEIARRDERFDGVLPGHMPRSPVGENLGHGCSSPLQGRATAALTVIDFLRL
jgi:hypothetical protein